MVIGVSKKSLNFDLDNGGLTVLKKASYVVFAWFNAFDLFVYSLSCLCVISPGSPVVQC